MNNKKLKIAILHPDLGIGGAERLVVDTGIALKNEGNDVQLYIYIILKLKKIVLHHIMI